MQYTLSNLYERDEKIGEKKCIDCNRHYYSISSRRYMCKLSQTRAVECVSMRMYDCGSDARMFNPKTKTKETS